MSGSPTTEPQAKETDGSIAVWESAIQEVEARLERFAVSAAQDVALAVSERVKTLEQRLENLETCAHNPPSTSTKDSAESIGRAARALAAAGARLGVGLEPPSRTRASRADNALEADLPLPGGRGTSSTRVVPPAPSASEAPSLAEFRRLCEELALLGKALETEREERRTGAAEVHASLVSQMQESEARLNRRQEELAQSLDRALASSSLDGGRLSTERPLSSTSQERSARSEAAARQVVAMASGVQERSVLQTLETRLATAFELITAVSTRCQNISGEVQAMDARIERATAAVWDEFHRGLESHKAEVQGDAARQLQESEARLQLRHETIVVNFNKALKSTETQILSELKLARATAATDQGADPRRAASPVSAALPVDAGRFLAECRKVAEDAVERAMEAERTVRRGQSARLRAELMGDKGGFSSGAPSTAVTACSTVRDGSAPSSFSAAPYTVPPVATLVARTSLPSSAVASAPAAAHSAHATPSASVPPGSVPIMGMPPPGSSVAPSAVAGVMRCRTTGMMPLNSSPPQSPAPSRSPAPVGSATAAAAAVAAAASMGTGASGSPGAGAASMVRLSSPVQSSREPERLRPSPSPTSRLRELRIPRPSLQPARQA